MEPAQLHRQTGNDGEELWQKLVRKNNFALVVCGHVSIHGYGFLVSRNDRGKRVYQMLADYQSRPRGGEAYLRILSSCPTANGPRQVVLAAVRQIPERRRQPVQL